MKTPTKLGAYAAVLVAMIDWVQRTSSEQENGELIGLAASGTLLVLVVLGYLYVPSLAGQLAAAFATMDSTPASCCGPSSRAPATAAARRSPS